MKDHFDYKKRSRENRKARFRLAKLRNNSAQRKPTPNRDSKDELMK